MKESTIEKRVSLAAIARGWETRKFVSPSRKGVPDRLYFRDGVVFFIEFKAPGKKPTALQTHELSLLAAHDIPAFVVDSVAAGLRVLEKME